jgi:hypothetical protein
MTVSEAVRARRTVKWYDAENKMPVSVKAWKHFLRPEKMF